MYATTDDQSNRTLVKGDLLDTFRDHSESVPYTLSSCSGNMCAFGRRAKGYSIQSFDNKVTLKLPTLVECNKIPNDRSEIATPDVARNFSHLKCIADQIPELDNQADIQILIGRDLIEAH